jgi:hypothetical protein
MEGVMPVAALVARIKELGGDPLVAYDGEIAQQAEHPKIRELSSRTWKGWKGP